MNFGDNNKKQTHPNFKQKHKSSFDRENSTLYTHALHLVQRILGGQIAPLLKSSWRAFAPYCLVIHHTTVSGYCYGNCIVGTDCCVAADYSVSTHNCLSLKSTGSNWLCANEYFISSHLIKGADIKLSLKIKGEMILAVVNVCMWVSVIVK